MIEAGAPSTGGWVVPAPPGVVMVAPLEVPRNAERAQSERPRQRAGDSAARGIIEAGFLHLELRCSEGVLSFARIATTLLQERLPWVTTLLYPTASERGVHARYALLGSRSALGSRRLCHCGRTVPIDPPLALAARCGPGLTHSTPPRPVNGERGAG